MERRGSAIWRGGLQDGTGTVSTESGTLSQVPYNFRKRFEDEAGTNPEELVGAAHASCFAMAFSMILGQHDLTPDEIEATATVTLEQEGEGFAVKKSHLDVTARVPGADEDAVRTAANAAKDGCPISKLLNCEVTMEARVET